MRQYFNPIKSNKQLHSDYTVITMSQLISFEQFSNAFTLNGYPAPSRSTFEILSRRLNISGIDTIDELAMFIAQVIHESGGLQYKKEWLCQQPETLNCPNSYRTQGLDVPGQYYYGRGYLQLTWAENYRQCSLALYGDDRLLQQPDLVSDTEDSCWSSALWYWSWRVHGVWSQGFQATTMAINGNLECASRGGPNAYKAIERFEKYKKVCNAFGVNPKGQAEC